MKRSRNAKIIATLGPSSSTRVRIEQLFKAGADVFRLNFSHGSHEDHKDRYDAIRNVEKELNSPIGIMMDLQGPKLRLGTFRDGSALLGMGRRFRLDLDETPGDVTRAPLLHPEIFAVLKPGMTLLLDDGKMRLKVLECGEDFAETEVMVDGVLSDRKGVNVPDAVLPLSALTEKDMTDLRYGLQLGVDWVALSFVQKADDIREARKIIGKKASIVAKLEKPSAIDDLDEIMELTDAVMVARGDLGVELPPEDVPILQKRIITTARKLGKPVIVATQMLDSMVSAPAPTRAEASDVATAVYDGSDAVMLSAETAAGDYPIETVEIMDRIIQRVEGDTLYQRIRESDRTEPEETEADAISAAARQVASTIKAAAIVTYTTTGSTSYRVARERPETRILGLTPKVETARKLALVWGVVAAVSADAEDFAEMVKGARKVAKAEKIGERGDSLVVTAGVPFGTPGATNILRIATIS
ncbi:Pyruvate kinase [Candidatus Terasakiella magnetica]|uniref:Pyruvate kinase n=1 Tax=Candidatus Terasakiella magnetica TaxID=1867952 RepID=A0A1C3RDI6_9PROT|nr:pyruvate kinase [Candidatus Terasakiella magnetica]SCA55346.1 Pyruvate kinase [Candidatus Terasakiella magnetica]